MNGGVRNDPAFYSLKLIILSDLFVNVSEDLQVKPVSRQDLIGADLASQVLPFTHVRVLVLFRPLPSKRVHAHRLSRSCTISQVGLTKSSAWHRIILP